MESDLGLYHVQNPLLGVKGVLVVSPSLSDGTGVGGQIGHSGHTLGYDAASLWSDIEKKGTFTIQDPRKVG